MSAHSDFEAGAIEFEAFERSWRALRPFFLTPGARRYWKHHGRKGSTDAFFSFVDQQLSEAVAASSSESAA